jgi:hypothetical protein
MTEQYAPEHFRPHVGKSFRVRGGRHDLTLADVSVPVVSEAELRVRRRRPFTLIFKGPVADVLREGVYTFEIEGGSAFEFYIMPIHTLARDRQNYQAAFN